LTDGTPVGEWESFTVGCPVGMDKDCTARFLRPADMGTIVGRFEELEFEACDGLAVGNPEGCEVGL